MTTPTITETAERRRTVAVATTGTVLALVAYTTPVGTLAATASALGAGPSGQAWILSSMSCGLAVALLPAGAIGDDHGRRRMFVVGALVLAAASVVATFAPDTVTLVLARIGQGLGAAAVLACGLGLIGHVVPAGPARIRATGVWGAGVGAGIAIGPLVAAGLAVAAALLAVWARAGLVESTAERPRAVDGWGMLLLGLALAGLLAGLVETRAGGPGRALALLVGGALAAVAFVVVELRRRSPMLDLRLLRRPDFAGATVGGLATGAGVIATMSFLPTLLQRALGHDALYAALLLLGWSATSVVAALLARRLPVSARVQMAAGLAGTAVGQVMLAGLDGSAGALRLLPGLVVAGVASGVLNAALGRQAVASAPPGLASVGSGANNTARYLGAAVGVTIVAVLAAHPEPAAMLAGWNVAVLVDAAVSAVGALLVLALRSAA